MPTREGKEMPYYVLTWLINSRECQTGDILDCRVLSDKPLIFHQFLVLTLFQVHILVESLSLNVDGGVFHLTVILKHFDFDLFHLAVIVLSSENHA